MDNIFSPTPGASGWQLSNPSALDMSSLLASLAVFGYTDMTALRRRSVNLTNYLEYLLLHWPQNQGCEDTHGSNDSSYNHGHYYTIITPPCVHERGAQLSVRLRPGLLEGVMERLEAEGVVVDERRPDVIRVAPAPLYNTFGDVWRFVDCLWRALGGLDVGVKG